MWVKGSGGDLGTMKRPGGVTFVALLIFIAAILNLILGIWLLLSPIGDNPVVHNSLGQASSVPTLWLIINGVLTLLLGLLFAAHEGLNVAAMRRMAAASETQGRDA